MRRNAITLFAIIAGAIYIHKQYAFVLFFFVPLATGFAYDTVLQQVSRGAVGEG